jgi:hypothetical protein
MVYTQEAIRDAQNEMVLEDLMGLLDLVGEKVPHTPTNTRIHTHTHTHTRT